MHFEPLRPHRSFGMAEKYEFTHGERSVCVYDIDSMDFVKEIEVGTFPDCHATSVDGKYLYIACFEGIYVISIEKLAVEKVIDTGRVYATNTLADDDTLLVHDLCGGVQLIKNITDMNKIHIHSRTQVIPNGQFRCEIGGKGNFIENGRYYLCSGWKQSKMYLFDVKNDFTFETFIDVDPRLMGSDDLVINADKTKAYTASHCGNEIKAHVSVIDIPKKKILGTIETGVGSCGLTMTGDERYVACSNDQDDSISVIDTTIDKVVNTPCAREGFDSLGITGYIQGISAGTDDSIFVYGCQGNGALVRFFDVDHANKYVISWKGGKYYSR